MNANDWDQLGQAEALKEATDLKLPSGMVIKARRPDLMKLATWGFLPMGLLGAASGESADASMRAVDLAQFMRTIVEYCCVLPRITMGARGKDQIHPSRIPDKDLAFIVDWAMRRSDGAPLQSFRPDRTDGSDRGDGTEVPPKTV